jgi:hypothetical protein
LVVSTVSHCSESHDGFYQDAIDEPATDGLGDVLSDRPALVWLADLHEAGPPTLWSRNQSSPDLVLWARETIEN